MKLHEIIQNYTKTIKLYKYKCIKPKREKPITTLQNSLTKPIQKPFYFAQYNLCKLQNIGIT